MPLITYWLPPVQGLLMVSNISADDQNTIALLQATGLFHIIYRLELYNGVILAYDHDEDVRLRGVVDRIKTPYLDEDLMVAYECDGTLTLIWKDSVPELFSQGKSVAATFPDDPFPHKYIDYWHIGDSVTAQSDQHMALLKAMSKFTGFGFSMNLKIKQSAAYVFSYHFIGF